MPPLDRTEVQHDPCLPAQHGVIIRRRKGQRHLPLGPRLRQRLHLVRCLLRRIPESHGRGGIKAHHQVPSAPARTFDGQPARPVEREFLRRGGGISRFGAQRLVQVLRHAQRAQLAVKAQGDAAALRRLDRFARLVRKVERWLPGIGGRFDPAFPGWSPRQRLRAARCHLGHRSHAQDRAEQKGHRQRQKRHVARGERIARSHVQIGGHRLRQRRARRHAGLMRLPHRDRCRISAADRLPVQHRRNGSSGQAGIQPRQRLGMQGPAEMAGTAHHSPQNAQPGRHHATPDQFDRKRVVQPQHQDRKHKDHHGPQGPERLPDPFGQKTGPGQEQRPLQPLQKAFRGLLGVCHTMIPRASRGDRVKAIRGWYLDLSFRQRSGVGG